MSEAVPTPDRTKRVAVGGGLIATKLYARPARTNLVVRPRVHKFLDEGLSASLILVSAPAGFGKTTLLTEWLARKDEGRGNRNEKSENLNSLHPSSLRLHPLGYAWLSLDAADNDPVRFWAYVILALQSIRDELGETTLTQLRSPQPPSAEEILPSLLSEIETFRDSGFLVLDDYHIITSAAVHSSLAFFLDNLPPSLHLIISARSDPPLPIAKLRARGQVLEVRADELRFTPDEAATFLNHTMGLSLSPDQVAALDERTEGWIAGLQMAALSMRGRDDIDGFIGAFAGTHRFVMDYLLEEVLAREPEEVQSFLLQTSILTRLTGPLCDAVIGRSEGSGILAGQEMLEKLERRNLFVVPLDDERIWYRYHHLFADLLRAQLRSRGAEGVAALHTRAADWHAQNGLVHEAINHASLAADDERVERFIEQNYMEMVSRGEQAGMRFWTGKLSRERVYGRPWLCIFEAYSHSWFGELDEADLLLEKAERHIQSGISTPDALSMQGQFAYVKSRVTAMRGDLHRAIEYCLAARENITAGNLALQFDSLVTLGYEYFLCGDYANASRILNETTRLGAAAGAIINTVAASCIMARLVSNQGLLHQSYDIYQRAAQLIAQAGGLHLDAKALVEIGFADVLYEWNDLDAALGHLEQGLALLPCWGKADDLVLAYNTLARIRLAQGNGKEASEAVEKASHLIQTRGVFSEARSVVETAQVKLWLAQGDLQAAGRWAASQDEHANATDQLGFENKHRHIARARVFLALKKPQEAIGLLSRLEEPARSAGRMGRVLEILLLQALAMHANGDSEHAILTLSECMTLAEPAGYVRLFVEEGEPMRSLLKGMRDTGGATNDYLEKLLSAFPAGSNLLPSPVTPAEQRTQRGASILQSSLIEPLTPRELEVLRLICTGESNQVIADKLVITVSAVKKHTGNILGKLGVTNRAQAIVKAHELGLFLKAP